MPMKEKSIVFSDQSGFTMIEAIFSLFLLISIMTLLPIFYYSYTAIDRSVELEEDYEWNIFIIQFRKELASMDSLRIGSYDRIYMEKNAVPVKYERHGMVIRRQVSETGHEVVLQNVRRMMVREEFPMLLMSVEFMNGSTRHASFLLPIKKEELS